MRVAFIGKGGVGKSAIAGTIARLLARRGERVLAIDSDPLPGLAVSLGISVEEAGIPDDAVVEKPEGTDGPRFVLRPDLDATSALEHYAAVGPDGVRFLQFAKITGGRGPSMRSQFAFRQIIDEVDLSTWSVVGDLPGGTRQPYFGWGDYADTLLIVVEPTVKSMLAARRLTRVQRKDSPQTLVAVVNKAREPSDAELVESRTGLPVIATIPYDDGIRNADRDGRSPLDVAPDGPAVEAAESLLERLSKGDAR